MTIDKNIFIKNVYYMLAYAFQELRRDNYKEIAGEDFDNIYQLFAEILAKGIAHQLKQGLHKSYEAKNDDLPTLKGKLDINGTIDNRLQKRMLMSCNYDELSENNTFNQIVKTTAELLINEKTVKSKQRQELRKLMLFFANVDSIDVKSIKWNSLRFDRNSRTYQMLLNICYFVIKDLLMTTETGKHKIYGFSDDNMSRLFEKFVLEYYKRWHSELKPKAKKIDWNIDYEVSDTTLLPDMKTDILLQGQKRTLIIDTKYYESNLQQQFDKWTIHSPNIYQIHSYVMNYDKNHTGKVDGMLLYAKTNADIQPHGDIFTNDGNILKFRVLDLNKDFNNLKIQLETIAKDYL